MKIIPKNVKSLVKNIFHIKMKRKAERSELEKYLLTELSNCTTHGLPNVVKDELYPFERFFWALSFICCSAMIFVLLIIQYSRFIKTPTVMSVEMDYYNWNISFPAITLCPVAKIDGEPLNDLVDEFEEKTGFNVMPYLWWITSISLENIERININDPQILSLIDPKDYAAIAAKVFKKFDNGSLTTNTDLPIAIDATMTEMGMCHVINSNVAVFDDPDKWHNDSISYVKSNIELSVHQRDFFTQITDYDGVYKVYIHSPDEVILSTTFAYTYEQGGFLSSVVQVWSTRISEELRLFPHNIRDCRFINEPISERYPIYSYNHCILECRINMIRKLCGCVPHFYRPLGDTRICNVTELMCIIEYKKDIITLSASKNTLLKFDKLLDLPRSARDCGCLNSCESDVYKSHETFIPQNDINRIRIGLLSFPKVRVVREIIFSYCDMLLKTGGVLNLCIGASVISLMELAIICIRIPVTKFIQTFKKWKSN